MIRKFFLGAFLPVFLTLGGMASAQDRFVDDDDVTCGGNSPCYSTIAAAFAAVAVDGETISVAAGSYSENLDLDRPVNLIGAGAGVTTISSASGVSEFLIRLGANVPITFSQGMVLEGFTLKGPLAGDEDLIMFRARVADANDPIIIRNNVFDCELDHDLKGIETRSGGNATNVVIENNTFSNECRYAMFLNTAINWRIEGNDVTSTWTGGFVMNTSDMNQLHDIDILDNTFDAVSSRPDAGGFLPNQFVATIGLSSVMFNVLVSGNSISNSGGHSITIGDRTGGDTTTLSNIVVECNSMDNNFGGALNELPTFIVPAENNWWGAASGPFNAGSNPGGTGDAVTDGFDFDPFLTAPAGDPCPPPENQPPDCSAALPTPSSCWPPNHKFVLVQIADVTDPDGDDVTITIDSITQDEAVDAKGSGNTCPDAVVVGDAGNESAGLRCERSGKGNGRVYEISFTADDGNGGQCSSAVTFCVPHNKKSTCVDDGQDHDSSVCSDGGGAGGGSLPVLSLEEFQLLTPAPLFLRGDVNWDEVVDMTDGVSILNTLFRGAKPFDCPDAADANDDGTVDITDATGILSYLFLSGPAPREPTLVVGNDPTEDGLGCE